MPGLSKSLDSITSKVSNNKTYKQTRKGETDRRAVPPGVFPLAGPESYFWLRAL